MALSRELTRRLRLDEEPLSKRLKLAENAFSSEDLPVKRKEDLVLKWLCQVGEDKNNDKFVWSTLSRCLASGDVISRSNDVERILIDNLVKKLSRVDRTETRDVLDCCKAVFENRETRRYFRSKISSLCDLTLALFSLISDPGESESSEKDVSSNDSPARDCAVTALECFVNCHKESSKKDEFAHIFVGKILYPLCGLVKENDELGAVTLKCVRRLIFGKSRYSSFKNYEIKDESNFAAKVFSELRKKANTSDENITVVVFLYVFRGAVGSYKNDPFTIDAILRFLVDSASNARIKVVASFRQQLTSLTLDYRNKIAGSTFFEYLQRLVDEIISSERFGSVHYEALGTIAILNPLVVETKMRNILKSVLLRKKETTSEIDSYRDLMIVLINAAVRLRREQKIISWILEAIDETLEENRQGDLNIDGVFPTDFKKQFGKCVGNMTSTQTIGVFRTLIFHLNKCVETPLGDEDIGSFMLRANVDLTSAYLEGVRIFDNSVAISGQDKFVRALRDLGKIVSSLTDKSLKIKRNKKIIVALFTVTWYWNHMHNWIGHYAPDVLPEELDFPISEIQMQQIIQKIDDADCKKAINRILIQRMGRNLKDEANLSSLLDGLEKSWSIIIDENPQIVSLMNNSDIAQLASFLLDDVRLSKNVDCSRSMERLSTDGIQNDERFVKTLVYQTLVDISKSVSESTTKIITGRVNVMKILDRGKISKLLKEIKKDFMKNEWISMNEESISVIDKNLKILSRLPLKNLSLDLRKLVIIVAYSIKKECENNTPISQLCTEITLDALEKFDIDVIDIFDSDSLINELKRDKSIQRVVESSLRNVSSWETLRVLIKNCQTNDDSAAILLECMDRVRSKLKNDDRETLRKAEKKLSKLLLDRIDGNCKDAKSLTVALKVSISNGEIPDNLITVTKSTLDRIFASEALEDEKLVTEGLQLLGVALKHRGKLALNDEIVNNIWRHVLKNPVKEIVQLLVETTEPKALGKLFTLLHAKTISGLDEPSENSFANALVIWNSITSVQMGGARHKLRTVAIQNLLKTLQISTIPVKFWPAALRFLRSSLSEALHVVDKGIDVVMLLAGRSLKETGMSACGDVLAVCWSLVKFNAGVITDRLPVLLALYRQIVRLVVRESRRDNDSSRERELGCLALEIEKFTNSLVKLKKDLARISPYVIADLVEIFSEGVVPSRVKGPVEDCVGHFLSVSDQHAISLLSRTLPIATQGIFKSLYETYNKFYKFTGKI